MVRMAVCSRGKVIVRRRGVQSKRRIESATMSARPGVFPMRALLACLLIASPLAAAAEPPKLADTFAMKNLVAWCIVPFDSQKRTPKQRVEMLQRLGFTQYAYDWRAEHLPSFPEEIELLKKAKISLKGVWFPAAVGKDGEFILEALKKADVKTELWVMLPQPKAETQDAKVKESASLVKGLAQR